MGFTYKTRKEGGVAESVGMGWDGMKDLLKLLASSVPFARPSSLEPIAVSADHVPVVPVHAELGRVVLFVVAGGECGVERTSVLEHGDGDVYAIFSRKSWGDGGVCRMGEGEGG